ncbi:MAG: response regulator [Cyanobacteriota bacterium]|nr:response regulator [Cyanobacteriota bacterium]
MYSNKNYKSNILIVDDTPDNLRLLSAMLAKQGYEVRKALNGKIALNACKIILPDLILLDINMPEMDGYEVCQQLKADETTNGVPVIFISALDDVLDKVRAFDVGGSDYISKPFHAAEVISRIENQINLRSLQIRLNEKNIFLQKTLENLKAAQVQQIQNEKMLALGHLVAGIAHEVNNPVSFIYGNLEYVEEYLRDLVNLVETYQQEYPHPTEKIQKIKKEIDLEFLMNDSQLIMDAMHRGAERIRSIVLALQNFSRHEETSYKRVNIHQGIESTLVMLQHRLKKTNYRDAIKIIKEYDDLPQVTCFPSELNQVFMHLLNNAVDALNKEAENFQAKSKAVNFNKTHTISISTKAIKCGSVTRISIADNGMGIPDKIRRCIFDPFFTTKPVGKGTGLGLSICYQIIVQKHSGKLICNSSPGEGTEFIIELPTEPSLVKQEKL